MASTSSQVLDSLMCAHNPTEILSRSFATRPKTLPRDDRLYIYRLSCHIVGDVEAKPLVAGFPRYGSAPEAGRRNPPLLPERVFCCDDIDQGRRSALPLATRRCRCRGKHAVPIDCAFENPCRDFAVAGH